MLKKLIAALFMLMCLLGLSSITTMAYSCPECGRYLSSYSDVIRYEYIDSSSHYAVYQCDRSTCQAVSKVKEEHDEDYSTQSYEIIDSSYHYMVRKCRDCGGIIKEKETHYASYSSESYEKFDSTYHNKVTKCYNCEGTIKEKEKHDLNYSPSSYTPYNSTYHYETYKCYDCKANVKIKKKHNFSLNGSTYYNKTYCRNEYLCSCGQTKYGNLKNHSFSKYSSDNEITRVATLAKKGIETRKCKNCSYEKEYKFNWKHPGDYDDEYESYDFSIKPDHLMYNRINTVKVKFDNKIPVKGAFLQIKIGKQVIKQTIPKGSKSITFKIKPVFYGEDMASVNLYYKGKRVGYGEFDDDDVWYAPAVRNGFTKQQVKSILGSPRSTSQSSYGYEYWNYSKASVTFRNGRVTYWYKYN